MAKTKELSDLIESLAGDLAPGDDLNAAVAMLKKRVLERALEQLRLAQIESPCDRQV